MRSALSFGGATVAVLSTAGRAVEAAFSLDSVDSTKKAAGTVAKDVLSYYNGNNVGGTPGILPSSPGGYYWYESAVMWSTLIDYWHVTGDSSHNELIMQGLLFQTGDDNDYLPRNQSATIGNDDQGLWAMAAMLAAERKFPDPPADQPQWLDLAVTVFNQMASPGRYGDECGGGLRWQIPFTNNGYDYKNSISNGCFFNLGARLARYTGNKTYSDWAEKTWDWMEKVGFLDNESYAVYDGATVTTNCTNINKIQYSYNSGVFTLGAAHMFNYTSGSEKWQKRTANLVDNGLKTFFPDGVAVEVACEKSGKCSNGMQLFKGMTQMWYSTAAQVAPFINSKISPVLKSSAKAALSQCTGGNDKQQCGFDWASGKYDGETRAEPEISVLGAVSSVLMAGSADPVTAKTGGTSKSGQSGGDSSDKDGSDKGGSSKDGSSKDPSPSNLPPNAGLACLTAGPNAGMLAVITLTCIASIAASVA